MNYISVRRLFVLVLASSIKSKQWSTFGDLPVRRVNRCATMGRPTIFLIFWRQSGAPWILKLLLIEQLYAWGLRDVVHAYVTPDRLSVAYRWSWSDLINHLTPVPTKVYRSDKWSDQIQQHRSLGGVNRKGAAYLLPTGGCSDHKYLLRFRVV